MQFELAFGEGNLRRTDRDWLMVAGRPVRLCLVRNRRARRYVLRLRPDGSARVAIPRGGSEAEARRFAARNIAWIEKERLRQAKQAAEPREWAHGTEIFFRGERLRVEFALGVARFGSEVVRVKDTSGELRPEIERHLWRLAARELPARVMELAALHQLPAKRVTVRNQRSRWGSCSRHGTISLNWRLVQTPILVRDYIILHELAHLKEMNHSRRFWREVARLCPEFEKAERWLKEHSGLLR
jgi:predicted metal-dependent hydrolase